MKSLHIISAILLIVGGLNWLIVGIWGTDIGAIFFGSQDNIVSRIIYILVGVAAVYEIFAHKSNCKACSVSAPSVNS